MPNPINITNIPAPRVDFIDPRTGLMSREWYRFFFNLFNLTGGGANDTSLSDLQIGPPVYDLTGQIAQISDSAQLAAMSDQAEAVLGQLGIVYDQAQLASMIAQYEQATLNLQNQFDTAPAAPQLGTIASYNLDGSPVAGGVGYGTGSAIAFTPVGTSGQFLTSAAAGVPTWSSPTSVAVTSFSAGTTGFTPSTATAGAVTLAGTLAVANGGTNASVAGIAAFNNITGYTAAGATGTTSTNLVFSTSPTLVTPVFTTSARFPLHIGGTATTSTLTFKTTTGVGAAGADIIFQVGNNGATEAMRVLNSGFVGVGTNAPDSILNVSAATPIVKIIDTTSATTGVGGNIYLQGYTNGVTAVNSFAIINGAKENATAANQSGYLVFQTSSSAGVSAERMRIDSSGNVGIKVSGNLSTLTVNGSFASKSPSIVNAATYTVAATDGSLRFTTTDCTVTLPTASSFPGRILYLNTITANSAISASANVIPLGSNTAGTAILAATAGKFAMLQSDGTSWITMMSN